MAEERDLALAHASDTTTTDEEASKEELQRRMEEARESITQTVTEIKETVTHQYQNVRESINDALDWREQFRRKPVAFSVGALSAGFIVGYSLSGGLTGGSRSRGDYDYDYNDEDTYGDTYANTASESQYRSLAAPSTASPLYGRSQTLDSKTDYSPSYSSNYNNAGASDNYNSTAGAADEQKPSIIDRFKTTQAFDKLQSEMYTLGDRVVDELSHVAQTTVLPMLMSKVKDLIGVDLFSGQQSGGRDYSKQQSPPPTASSMNDYTAPSATQPTSAGAGGASKPGAQSASSSPSPQSYGTSENVDYGKKA